MPTTTLTLLLLAVTFVGITAFGQAVSAPTSTVDKRQEELSGQLEEIAMCHHAIKAAYHDGLAFGQNPYYRYIIYSPHKGQDVNVYPVPERCKSQALDWILDYTKLDDKNKAARDKIIFSKIGMTIPDMATDVEFLTVVINKMRIEGKEVFSPGNEDKDIPSAP